MLTPKLAGMAPTFWVDGLGSTTEGGIECGGTSLEQVPVSVQKRPAAQVPQVPPQPSLPHVRPSHLGVHAGQSPQGSPVVPHATRAFFGTLQKGGQQTFASAGRPKRAPLPSPQTKSAWHSLERHCCPCAQTGQVPPQPSETSPPQTLPVQLAVQSGTFAMNAGVFTQRPHGDVVRPHCTSACSRQATDQQ